jgi:peptidoglycan/xylan/chitin deacetylase (PgdA/CDA1 family)
MSLKTALHALRAFAWKRSHSDFLLVCIWHQVTPVFDPLLHHKFTWTELKKFEIAIDYLASKFEVLPLQDAISQLNRGTLRGPCAALTFDDGDISMAEHVVPLLRKRNLPATFFINSAYLQGNRSYWFPILSYLCADNDASRRASFTDELKNKALRLRSTSDPTYYDEVRNRVERLGSFVPNLGSRLVSAEWLSRLDGDQFTIGAHGHEHQRFSMMPPEWQANNLRENIRVLSEFQAYRPIFAVPFGRPWDWTEQTIHIAREHALEVVLADGTINVGSNGACQRVPSDGRAIRPLITTAMSDSLARHGSHKPLNATTA